MKQHSKFKNYILPAFMFFFFLSCISFCQDNSTILHQGPRREKWFFIIIINFKTSVTNISEQIQLLSALHIEGWEGKSLMIWCMTFSSFFIERNYKLKNNKTINLLDCAFCWTASIFFYYFECFLEVITVNFKFHSRMLRGEPFYWLHLNKFYRSSWNFSCKIFQIVSGIDLMTF